MSEKQKQEEIVQFLPDSSGFMDDWINKLVNSSLAAVARVQNMTKESLQLLNQCQLNAEQLVQLATWLKIHLRKGEPFPDEVQC